LVVEGDVGDHAGQRSDDVGGIPAAAETGFPNHQVDALFGKPQQRQHRGEFEKGGGQRIAGCPGVLGLEGGAEGGGEPGQLRFRQQAPVDLDPFAEADQVRRRKEPHAPAAGPVDALQQSADGTLAVGPGHVDKGQPIVRIADQSGQATGGGQSRLKAELLQGMQVRQGLRDGHSGSIRSEFPEKQCE